MISYSNSLSRGSGMPIQVHGVLVHAMSGTELSRVRTEFRLHLPEPINKDPLESRGPTLLRNQIKCYFKFPIRALDQEIEIPILGMNLWFCERWYRTPRAGRVESMCSGS